MSITFERVPALATGATIPRTAESENCRLDVSVVFTTVEATIAALKRAAVLAARLDSRITLLVPQAVPYPLPLSSPPVLLDFSERRFRVIAEQSAVETRVRLYLCRDPWETLQRVLRPGSMIVVGARKRWWPGSEKRLANRLRRAGHHVIFMETE